MANIVDWSDPPRDFSLNANEAHIWRAQLDVGPHLLSRLSTYLSAEETNRAKQFVFPRDRDHFVAARGILRELLGRCSAHSPASICFSQGPHGKPFLVGKLAESSMRFNISHSHGWALFAITLGNEVGIDIERIRPEVAKEEIAERYFSTPERDEFRGLPSELRVEAFFLCWTSKEAYVKARGAGLQLPLDSFDVALVPGHPATLRSDDQERWDLRSFAAAPEYVAALAVERTIERTYFWEYRG